MARSPGQAQGTSAKSDEAADHEGSRPGRTQHTRRYQRRRLTSSVVPISVPQTTTPSSSGVILKRVSSDWTSSRQG